MLNQKTLSQIPEVSADVPESPEAALSQDGMRANLEGMFSQVAGKINEVQGMQTGANSTLEAQKKDMVKSVFDRMMSIGVDPSNLEQVTAFLQDLEQNEPDLYELFAGALDSLLGAAQPVNPVQ